MGPYGDHYAALGHALRHLYNNYIVDIDAKFNQFLLACLYHILWHSTTIQVYLATVLQPIRHLALVLHIALTKMYSCACLAKIRTRYDRTVRYKIESILGENYPSTIYTVACIQ